MRHPIGYLIGCGILATAILGPALPYYFNRIRGEFDIFQLKREGVTRLGKTPNNGIYFIRNHGNNVEEQCYASGAYIPMPESNLYPIHCGVFKMNPDGVTIAQVIKSEERRITEGDFRSWERAAESQEGRNELCRARFSHDCNL